MIFTKIIAICFAIGIVTALILSACCWLYFLGDFIFRKFIRKW